MAVSAHAVEVITPADLADPSRWVPLEGTPPAEVVTEEGKTYLKLPCPFSALTGWRYAWDITLDADLKDHRWLKLRAKADDPDAVAEVVLYFESGSGWYRGGLGGLTPDWSTLVGRRVKFSTEGVPAGWNTVTRMRLAVIPAAKRDTTVYIGGLEGTSAVSLEDAARVGPYQSLAELRVALTGSTAAEESLRRGEALIKEAAKHPDISAAKPQQLIQQARSALVDAYVRAQKPKPGELRGAWCHSGTGPPMGWTKTIEALADNGFNAIFPNLLWSGIAYYPSKVVPVAPEVASRGDQLKEILAAAKRRGVAVHVWKVSWQFGWMTDPKVAVPFRFAGRLQVDQNGKQGGWLCPSNPKNRKYELDAIRELVRNYDIDGFHLDYIRFNGNEWCFCPSCRKAFQKSVRRKLKDWPAPVVEGGKYEQRYLEFRRDLITSFVRETRKAIKKIKPEMKLSAAVFPLPHSARKNVLQDWVRWVHEGLLDFVCPMIYTENLSEMRSRAKAGLDAVAGKVPLYVGMYATYAPDQRQEPDMAVAQIVAARELGASGFVLFEIQDHVLTDLLPVLRLGVTAP